MVKFLQFNRVRGDVEGQQILAAARVNVEDPNQRRKLQTIRIASMRNNQNAWKWYDSLGELHFGINRSARIAGHAQIVPKRRKADGTAGPVVKNSIVQGVYGQLWSPLGGQRHLIEQFIRLRKLKAHLHLVRNRGESGEFNGYDWVSDDELLFDGDLVKRLTLPMADGTSGRDTDSFSYEIRPEDYLGRVWTPHPRYCADEATEILTTEGWRRHGELNIGDSVLTLDHQSGLSRWSPVLAVNRFEVNDEPMLAMDSKRHSSLTTLDHRWPVVGLHSGRRVWKNSRTLSTADVIVTAAPCSDLPTEPKYSDAFVELVAWYWTEGSAREPVIHQSLRANPHHVESIRSCLTALFGPRSEGRMGSNGTIRDTCGFDDCGWPARANGLCNAHNEQRREGRVLRPVRRRSARPSFRPAEKQPTWTEYLDQRKGMVAFRLNATAAAGMLSIAPRRQIDLGFVRSLTLSQLELFIRRSLDADGHVSAAGTAVIAQKDRAMLEPFELACVLAGYAPRTVERRYTAWTRWETTVGRARRAHVADMRSEQRYSGTVWCPTTTDATWCARRDGKVFFTGNSEMPDCAMSAVDVSCEQLSLLQQSFLSKLVSRLAMAGILYLPTEISEVTTGNNGSAGRAETNPFSKDPVLSAIVQSFLANKEDHSSAAASMPILIRGPAQYAEAIRHILLDREIYDVDMQLMEKALHRILLGLDLQPTSVLGFQDSNHWDAWADRDEELRTHITPELEAFCFAMEVLAIAPALEEAGVESSNVMTVADPSGATTRPNQAEDAKTAADRLGISLQGLRAMSGISEEYAPNEVQYVQQLGAKIGNPYLATFGMPVHDTIDWDKAATMGADAPGPDAVDPTGKSKKSNATPDQGAPGNSESDTPKADRPAA